MKFNLFAQSLKSHTAKTSNITTSEDSWECSGIEQVPNNISNRIENVVALLQAKVKEGYWCEENECLMIYDLEVLDISEQNCLCALSIIIKPLDQINNLGNPIGVNLQLVINGNTGEIGNEIYGRKEMGLLDEEVLEESSIVYGNYKEYLSSSESCLKKDLKNLFVKERTYDSKDSQFEDALAAGAPLYFTFRTMKSFDLGNIIDSPTLREKYDDSINYSPLKSKWVI